MIPVPVLWSQDDRTTQQLLSALLQILWIPKIQPVELFPFLSFFFAVVIIIAIGIWLVGKKIIKTQESQESKASVETDPLSFSSQLYKIVTEQKTK